jgi:hypothetical protein
MWDDDTLSACVLVVLVARHLVLTPHQVFRCRVTCTATSHIISLLAYITTQHCIVLEYYNMKYHYIMILLVLYKWPCAVYVIWPAARVWRVGCQVTCVWVW